MSRHQKRTSVHQAILLMCLLFNVFLLRAQHLTIYTIPAPHPFHWESPGRLVFSYIRNAFSNAAHKKYRHPIGHMMVHLKDSTREVIAGVSAVPHSGMTKKVLFNGYGLGILFERIKGKLDETAVNLPDIQQRTASGEIAFLQFRVSQAAFDLLWRYYSDYKEKGLYKIYNGLNHPFAGEGAGCSAFAFSFLDVAGLQDMIPFEICGIDRAVPLSLIHRSGSSGPKVSLFRLLFSRKWAAEQDPEAHHYRTYEPTWLYEWIRDSHSSIPLTGNVQQSWISQAPGILIDCRDLPVPAGPIWKF